MFFFIRFSIVSLEKILDGMVTEWDQLLMVNIGVQEIQGPFRIL